jgi:hypothetical protein
MTSWVLGPPTSTSPAVAARAVTTVGDPFALTDQVCPLVTEMIRVPDTGIEGRTVSTTQPIWSLDVVPPPS